MLYSRHCAVPTRTGFAFTGWNSAPNGSGTTYVSGETYVLAEKLDVLPLYAQWSETGSYAISWHKNGAMQLHVQDLDSADLTAVLAIYDEQGRMLTMFNGVSEKGDWIFQNADAIPSAASACKFLFLNQKNTPVREALPVTVTELIH